MTISSLPHARNPSQDESQVLSVTLYITSTSLSYRPISIKYIIATHHISLTLQRIGYIRVSSFDQNAERQLENVEVDRTFSDKASGKNTLRPKLEELLAFVRDGDTVVVHSMDRLARNLDDLRRIVQGLTKRGVRIEFVKECLTFTGEDSPMSTLLLSVMGAFAEFERALIRERQREGITLAKKRGAYRGRRKALSKEQIHHVLEMISAGRSKTDIARQFSISRETLYQYLRTA